MPNATVFPPALNIPLFCFDLQNDKATWTLDCVEVVDFIRTLSDIRDCMFPQYNIVINTNIINSIVYDKH